MTGVGVERISASEAQVAGEDLVAGHVGEQGSTAVPGTGIAFKGEWLGRAERVRGAGRIVEVCLVSQILEKSEVAEPVDHVVRREFIVGAYQGIAVSVILKAVANDRAHVPHRIPEID